jgi:hypothetical protein
MRAMREQALQEKKAKQTLQVKGVKQTPQFESVSANSKLNSPYGLQDDVDRLQRDGRHRQPDDILITTPALYLECFGEL